MLKRLICLRLVVCPIYHLRVAGDNSRPVTHCIILLNFLLDPLVVPAVEPNLAVIATVEARDLVVADSIFHVTHDLVFDSVELDDSGWLLLLCFLL